MTTDYVGGTLKIQVWQNTQGQWYWTANGVYADRIMSAGPFDNGYTAVLDAIDQVRDAITSR